EISMLDFDFHTRFVGHRRHGRKSESSGHWLAIRRARNKSACANCFTSSTPQGLNLRWLRPVFAHDSNERSFSLKLLSPHVSAKTFRRIVSSACLFGRPKLSIKGRISSIVASALVLNSFIR